MRGPVGNTAARAAGPILSAAMAFVIVLGAGLVTSYGGPDPAEQGSGTRSGTSSPTEQTSPPTGQPEEASQPEDPVESDRIEDPNSPAASRPEDGAPTKKAGPQVGKSDADRCRPTPLCAESS